MNLKTILPSKGSKVWRNSALLLLALVGVPMLSFLPVDSRITGRVFRDFNANGVFDTTPIEVGVAGVTVTAFTPTGSSVSATTGADGTYSLVTVTGTKYRIEFTSLETGDFESAYGSATGNNGTSVQFAASGDVNVNLGVNYPAQYSSTTNPKVITSGFISGNQSGSSYSTNVLWGVSHNATATPTKIDLGTAQQYGSIWGTAYGKTSKNLYVAAFTKRYVGFGPSGSGAIYVTQTSGDVSAAAPTAFYVFPDNQVGGSATAIHGDLGAAPGSASTDNTAYDNVGKTSLGDIELSEDEKDLYVVNLADRTLNKINVATKQKTQTIAIPSLATGARASDYRPFALKVYRGKVYVGVVSTNESSYDNSTYQNTANYRSDKGDSTALKAAVFSFDGSSFTKVLDFPLTYKKQASNADQTGTSRAEYWRPWTNTYRTDRESPASYPQAWLTNIEFDVTGEMILGIRDRFGDQMGYNNLRPTGTVGPSDASTLSCITPGEILRAGKTLTGWKIESAGSVGGNTASASQLAQVGPGGHGKYYYGDVVDQGANHGSSSAGGLALLAGSGKVVMTAMDPTNDFNTGGIKRLVNSTGANDGGATLYSSSVINWGKANGMGDVELLTAPAPIEIGNRVWIDKDSDGIQDGDETGLAGVSIQLLAANGTTVIATAVTDANGNYIFSNAAGTNTTSLIYGLAALTANTNYSLKILNTSGAGKLAVFSGYSLTGANKDATTNGDNRDSNGIASTTNTMAAVTTGNNGENNHSFDFGFAPVGSIGDYVWYDANRDGLQTSGELPAPNVTVTLQRSTDGGTNFTNFATATTGSDGKYLFPDLETGTYKVIFTKPTGYDFTTKGTTASSNTDSNPDVTGASGIITINTALTAGDIGRDNLTIDAGLAVYGSLGDYVWYDTNYDGLQTTGEAVASNVTVTLWKSADGGTTWNKTFATATTGSDGKYLFDRLESATYKVVFTKPTGYEFTATGTTAASGSDSNAGTTGETANVTINTALTVSDIGRNNLTIDAGLVAYGSIGDYVWYDSNYDGQQTTGEAVAPNIPVTLWKSTDGGTTWNKTFATTTTGSDGKYLFSGLQTATYKVVFTKPSGFDFTTQGSTAASNTDSNVGTTGESGNISIDAALASGAIGRDNLTIDAGLVAYGSIGDYVWLDANKDGSQTSGEAAVSGVTVKLWKLISGTTYNESFATTTTDANGKYTFSGLQSGTYKVQFVLPGDKDFTFFQKSGITTTTNSDAGTNGLSDAIVINTTLASGNIGRDNPTIDAGLVAKGALPVTLTDFNGSKEGSTSLLNWSTTAETNSAYFEVQRSTDGKNWIALGNVLALGESSDLHKYDFTDGNPVNGENLYRLKMVDLDQTYAYSRIISITLEVGYKLSVFPNPTSDVVKIETSNGASVQKVEVYSLIGKLVKEVVSPKGGEISVQQLPSGMYMLRITTSNGSVETRKVVVVR